MIRMILLIISLTPFPVVAHHSFTSFYDQKNIIELTGIITSVTWRNPHIRFSLNSMDKNGETTMWKLEGGSVNSLERAGYTSGILKTGKKIRVKGPVSRHGQKKMLAAIATLEDGKQVTLFPIIAAKLGLDDMSKVTTLPSAEEAARDKARQIKGIYRVWTPRGRPNTGSVHHEWPLKPSAKAAREAFNPLTDDPALKCIAPGMPAMLDTPYPIEFIEQGNNIIIRFEEWDGVRTIDMNPAIKKETEPASPSGYSAGRWEGNTLVVITTNSSYPYFDDTGTPQSQSSEITERYTVSEDKKRLDWEATVVDPEIFTEPVTMTGYMAWVAGEKIKPYNCKP